MRYKVGDKVWIREDLSHGKTYGGYNYQINMFKGEQDIRGLEVEITGFRNPFNDSYKCDLYSGITDAMIDHEKSVELSNPSYEVY